MSQHKPSSNRIFHNKDGNWHVRIRGNYTLGPFASNFEARDALQKYVKARSPDFISLNLPRWLHIRFWFRLFKGTGGNLQTQKQISHS